MLPNSPRWRREQDLVEVLMKEEWWSIKSMSVMMMNMMISEGRKRKPGVLTVWSGKLKKEKLRL